MLRNRQHFDDELIRLHDELIRIGTMVESALSHALRAVRDYDGELAERVVSGDAEINQAVQQLHARAIGLIARQQPMASDLRTISVTISLLPELERMGDHAATICKLQRRMMDMPGYVPLDGLPDSFRLAILEMGQRAIEILHAGVEALRSRDRTFASKVVAMDDAIDHLYAQIFRETIDLARARPDLADEAIHLLNLAHNLERIGDRVTNVAEQIIFLLTGNVVELNY